MFVDLWRLQARAPRQGCNVGDSPLLSWSHRVIAEHITPDGVRHFTHALYKHFTPDGVRTIITGILQNLHPSGVRLLTIRPRLSTSISSVRDLIPAVASR